MKRCYLLRGRYDYENVRNGASLTYVGEGSAFWLLFVVCGYPWNYNALGFQEMWEHSEKTEVRSQSYLGQEMRTVDMADVSRWSQCWSAEMSDLQRSPGLSLPFLSWLIIISLGGFGCSFC